MDFFQFMLIICFIIGTGFVLYSIVNFYGAKENDEDILGFGDINEKLSAFDNSISEADSAINELNNMSQNVFKEIDDKYKELLFLYKLIDEKRNGSKSDSDSGSYDLSNKASEKIAPKIDLVVDDET